MVTRTGDREIGVVSGRLPDNPGELACMILWKCLNTFVLLHCGPMNLQAYKSCYASQRETVARNYVWITSVSNSFHCSSVLQPLSQSACVKHMYSNNNQRITPFTLIYYSVTLQSLPVTRRKISIFTYPAIITLKLFFAFEHNMGFIVL